MRHFIYNNKKYIAGGSAALALAVTACSLGTIGGGTRTLDQADRLADNDKKAKEATKTDAESLDTDKFVEDLKNSVKFSEKDIYKDETVYVFADANGNKNQVLVNEVLRNPDKKAELTDATDLTGIVNLKGDETFSQDGDQLTWQANGEDIYYQGTTDKELPVTMKATYYLDGKEVSPSELGGKSGHVKMRFDYTNNTKVTKKIGGKDEEVTVPFVAVTGMILGKNFSNITVTNGKATSEGNNNIVLGYALPGLTESLHVGSSDFDSGITLPDYFELEADVDDFSLDMTMTILLDASALNMEGNLDLSEVDKLVNQLDDASNQLESGSRQLADGTETLNSKMGEFTSGVGQLKSGIDTLNSKTGVLADGVNTLNSSAAGLSAGIATLDGALNTPMTDEQKTDTYNTAYSVAKSQASEAAKKQAAEADYSGVGAQAKKQVLDSTDFDAVGAKAKKQALAGVDIDGIAAQAKQGALAQLDLDAIGKQAGESAAAAFASGDQAAQIKNGVNQKVGEVMAPLASADTYAAALDQAGFSDTLGQLVSGSVYQSVYASVKQSLMGAGIPEENADAAAQQAAQTAAAQAVAGAADSIGQIKAGVAGGIAQGIAGKLGGIDMGSEVVGVCGQVAAGTASEAAKQTAQAVAGQVAEGVAKSIVNQAVGDTAAAVASATAKQTAGTVAEQLAPTVAKQAATTAAETAAGEAAGQAAGTAAVSGVEVAKRQIASQIEATQANGYSLVTGAQALAAGTNTLAGNVPALTSGVGQLASGAGKLADGSAQLADGVSQLNDGAGKLADGMAEFNKQAIDKLIGAYNGDVKELAERIQAVLSAATEYDTFTKLNDGDTGMTKFIIKTEGISSEED